MCIYSVLQCGMDQNYTFDSRVQSSAEYFGSPFLYQVTPLSYIAVQYLCCEILFGYYAPHLG